MDINIHCRVDVILILVHFVACYLHCINPEALSGFHHDRLLGGPLKPPPSNAIILITETQIWHACVDQHPFVQNFEVTF